jgi:ferredoxin
MQRTIIRINEEKCTGCEECIPNCPEGALKIVNGKARLAGDSLCDGLGACLGRCPEGAITVEVREAEAYDERTVIANIAAQGAEAVESHLKHLREHDETAALRIALEFLGSDPQLMVIDSPRPAAVQPPRTSGGCPGSQSMSFGAPAPQAGPATNPAEEQVSQLTHWPIQLHLINPAAPHFEGSDLLLAADCVPFSLDGFHSRYLQGRTLAIGCPKLDDGQEVYLSKLVQLIDSARIRSINVMIMQVPCCSGLFHLATQAVERATRKIPIHYRVIGIRGEVLQEGTVS